MVKRRKSLWIDKRTDRHAQIIALLFFAGFFMLLFFGSKTVLSWWKISRIYAGFAVLFAVMPYAWYPFVYRIRKYLRVLLIVAGLAPFFTGVFLGVNYLCADNEREVTVKIKEYFEYPRDKELIIVTEAEILTLHKSVRTFYTLLLPEQKPEFVKYKVKNGCFGIDVIKDGELLYK